MSDAYSSLIESLAQSLVADYLAAEAAQDVAPDQQRTEPVRLPAMDKAA